MCRITLLSALLVLSGCSDRPPRPGDEVIAFSGRPGPADFLKMPSHDIYGLADWDEDRPICWLPVGTRLRVASDEVKGKVMVLVLEGQYAGKSLAVSRNFLRRP